MHRWDYIYNVAAEETKFTVENHRTSMITWKDKSQRHLEVSCVRTNTPLLKNNCNHGRSWS